MKIIKGMFPYFKKQLPGLIGSAFFCAAALVLCVILPQMTELIVDRIVNPALGAEPKYNPNNVFNFLLDGFAPDDYGGMFFAAGTGLAIVCLLRYCCHYFRWDLAYTSGINAENSIRNAVFDKMSKQSCAVTDRYTNGDLLNILHSDPANVKVMFSEQILIIVEQVLTFALSVFFLARISPYLLIVPLGIGVGVAVNTVFYTRIMHRRFDDIRDRSAELTTTVQENINGVRVVRAYASEEIEIKKFDRNNVEFRNAYIRHAKSSARFGCVFNAAGWTMSIVSVALGIWLCLNGEMTVGQYATFLVYTFMIKDPMIIVMEYFGAVQNSVVCGERLMRFLDEPLRIADPVDPAEVGARPHFALDGVSVRIGDRAQLVDVSVDLPYGKHLGIMGKTGSGKSILMKTIARFYDASEGCATLDGRPVSAYRVEDVRRQCAFVLQDVFLFSDTVTENIAFCDENADRARIEEAARLAAADKFVRALPDGYETIVGERGLGLSGGQKQRVSVARALLKDAPVLMLDDATSALDLETEREVLHNVRTVYADRTLVIATHRAASVRDCDEILFLEDGRIVERGTHDELMACGGRYCTIYTEQQTAEEETR